MRKATKIAASIFGLGSIAIGYQVGTAAEVSTPFADSASSAAQPTNSASAAVATPAAPPAESTASQVASPAKTSTPVASATASSAPAASKAPASSSGSTSSHQGAAIAYRYGTIQVTIAKSGSKISAVNLDVAQATGGREQAFSYLVQYTIDANGTNYGNLSGATYTTAAFKKAVESALAKF